MELKTLCCPDCGATLEIEDGLDTFFCKYCGHKFVLTGQSKAAYEAKVHAKQMEHEERLQDKKDAQERYRMESKQKSGRRTLALILGFLSFIICIIFIYSIIGSVNAKKQERELQAIVEQIMLDIENENFAAAYIKAESLQWNTKWTYEGEDKWRSIRWEIIDQIEAAEQKVAQENGEVAEETEEEPENKGFRKWFKK